MPEEIAEEFAEYTASIEYEDLDKSTVELCKGRLVDSMACAYGAIDTEALDKLYRFVEGRRSHSNASLLGAEMECAVEYATLLNGTLVRYLDWNDMYTGKTPGHPSDNLGSILSVGDAVNASGKDIILNIALGYEIQCRLSDTTELWRAGFDHVNNGLISASLTSGKLLGLSEKELAQAVNIALSSHINLRQNRLGELSEWKGIAYANAARNGVVAAELAKNGVNGPSEVFEGKCGYFNQVSGSFSLDFSEFGSRFKIHDCHIKPFPVGYHITSAVIAALKISEKGVDWRDIEDVRIFTYAHAKDTLGEEEEKWRPKTRETADHSMPYCAARTLIDGEMTLEQYAPEKLGDEDVIDLMDKIEVIENESFTEMYGEYVPHRMVVETKDSTYEHELRYPKGHAENPLSEEEINDKFRGQAEKHLDTERVERKLEFMRDLENQDDISELFASGETQ